MSKISKIWLIIATSLIAVGATIFIIAMSLVGWDFTKLSTVKFETTSYTIDEEFKNISIETSVADIQFAISDDGECKVVCYEPENMKHTVEVKTDTLTINVIDNRKWYNHIGISMGSSKITIYLPKKDYASAINIETSTGDINVDELFVDSIDFNTSTGDIRISNVICSENISINVSTGDVKLNDVNCKIIISDGSTGDVSMEDVIVDESISVERSTGDIKLSDCDGNDIYIKTSTGDIKGSLLTDKVFITKSSTGDIKVPNTSTGGKCELSTSTGDIKITISN